MDRPKFTLLSIVATAIITALIYHGVLHVNVLRQSHETARQLSEKLSYYEEAEQINDYYSRFNIVTRVNVIRQTLECIDKHIKSYFPNQTFNRRDFIAIAMVESNFDQYLVGRDKEFGIFQILPESSKWAGVKKNQFDIEVNTEMSMFVLQKKYEQHKDYKMSIIAYNGVVKSRGKVSEVYWDKFIKARKAVDDILGNNNLPNK